MDVPGGGMTRLTDHGARDGSPNCSPDGARIAFMSRHNSAPRWSPDGSNIAFYGQVGEGLVGADIMTRERSAAATGPRSARRAAEVATPLKKEDHK